MVGRRRRAALMFSALLCLCSLTGFAADTNALAKFQNVHRIIFLGDSITYAGGYIDDIEAYYVTRFPGQHFEFINVGLASETVSGLSEEGHAGGKFRRPDVHERLGRVLEKTKPDLAFVCYGMNDGIYQPFDTERFKAFTDGMESVHAQLAAAGVKIIHLTPPTFDAFPVSHKISTNAAGNLGSSDPYAGYNEVLDRFSDWLMAQRVAGWDVADLHGPMNHWLAEQRQRDPNFNYTKDGIHPDAAGHWVMAKQVLLHLGATDVEKADSRSAMVAANPHGEEILKFVHEQEQLLRDAWLNYCGFQRPGVKAGLPVPEAEIKSAELDKKILSLVKPNENASTVFPGATTNWEGFERHDFDFNGNAAIVVVPPHPLPGKPWAWRGEFFGAYANADAELVAKGFYLVYLHVPDLFGSPTAVKYWDDFYAELTGKYGLAKKVALIGLSRGGLYCYNWAEANPDKVACIYADAPVCDFKSWPGGKLKNLGQGEGSASEWAKMLAAYGFKSDAEAIAFRGNPIDHLEPLEKAGIPLLHVYGDADKTVPSDENTGVLAERYKKLGGDIILIPKPGGDHHPHGLTNPAPIVDFILKYAATNS